MTNPLRRFIVVGGFSIGLVAYWFLTIGQSSDFPTGEVQYAVMPALLHPYLYAWEAPYSIIWYAIQWMLIGIVFPGLSFFSSSLACPNHCVAVVHYTNGTLVNVPFEAGPKQWIMSLSWMIGLALFNLGPIWLLRKSEMLIAYFMTSMWLWATTPVNLPILWIILLAYLPIKIRNYSIGWLFLPLALIIKLPVGAPSEVWTYALKSGSVVGHFFPYILLGFWTVGLSIHWIDKAFHQGNAHWFQWLDPNWRVISSYE